MTKEERKIVKEILFIAENNPGGYIEVDELNECDDSPEDMGVFNASLIRKRCLQLLGEIRRVSVLGKSSAKKEKTAKDVAVLVKNIIALGDSLHIRTKKN